LTDEEIELIFRNIESIVSLHHLFLTDLKQQQQIVKLYPFLQRDSGLLVAKAFLNILPFLKLYGTYVQGHEEAVQALQKLRKESKKWQMFETVNIKQKNNNLDLEAYLIMPVRRLPRYMLLMKDLLRYSYKQDPNNTPIIKEEKNEKQKQEEEDEEDDEEDDADVEQLKDVITKIQEITNLINNSLQKK